MKLIYLLLGSCLYCTAAFAQLDCQPANDTLTIYIATDEWGYETSYQLATIDGVVLSAAEPGTYSQYSTYAIDVCIDTSSCLVFSLYDTYGDGIYPVGGAALAVNGDTIWTSSTFQYETNYTWQCPPGATCTEPLVIEEGQYLLDEQEVWYVFTPAQTGLYEITTCEQTTCPTTIWVYDTCPSDIAPADNQGTIFYSNQNSPCFPQADLQGGLEGGTPYLIRVGSTDGPCAADINWSVTFVGPISGCTDVISCNFDPLATIDDGSCIAYGDPLCPNGPDLALDQERLTNTIEVDYIEGDDACLIEEDCIRGFGTREIIRFSTRIDNIGEEDYYIGMQSSNNDQFTYSSCHNHFHYDSYAEYILFTTAGERVPAGFKNGFCVLDLGCTWGDAKYGCGNMGITAGCYDEYWSSLECQWIDITDVPDGDYTLVVRTNWKNAPDALGRFEKDSLNNWAQACINIDRLTGTTIVTVADDCPTFVDCAGNPYGETSVDCEGVCGGPAIIGDLDGDGVKDMNDVMDYLDYAINTDIPPSSCTDLNSDGLLTVYDATLLNSCLQFGSNHVHNDLTNHDHCDLPGGFYSEIDTVTLTIEAVDWEAQYLDIAIRTPYSTVSSYQFTLSGIQVSSVENRQPEEQYAATLRAGLGNNMILGAGLTGDMIPKSVDWQPLCRVYFSEVTDVNVCIDQIIDVVNERLGQLAKVVTQVENACILSVGVTDATRPQLAVKVAPNPMQAETVFQLPPSRETTYHFTLSNGAGQQVQEAWPASGADYRLLRGQLPAGIYLYRFSNADGVATGRLVIQ